MSQAASSCAAPSCHTAWLSATPASTWWRIGAAAFLAMNTMTAGLAVNMSASTFSERRVIHVVLLLATLAVFALLGRPLLAGLAESWRARRFSIEPLFALGLSGAFTASTVSTWRNSGPVYYEVSSILLVIYSLGKVVTGEAEGRAMQAIAAAARKSVTCLVRAPEGGLRELAVSEVGAGDLVAVPAGAELPIDGVISEGEALCRTAAISGESFLAAQRPGDFLHAGAIPVDGSLLVQAASPGTDRLLDRVAAAIEESRRHPSPLQREADRMAHWLTPSVALASILTAAFWWFRSGADAALLNGLSVLVIACPCALGFATPLAVWAAISRFALRGARLRNGEAIERLAEVDIVLFDKTGTLTSAEPVLAAFAAAPACPWRENELLEAAAAIEALSSHPIATAFRPPLAPSPPRFAAGKLRLLPGQGVEAELAAIGSKSVHHALIGLPERCVPDEFASDWRAVLGRLRPAPADRLLALLIDGRLAAGAALAEQPLTPLGPLFQGLEDLGVESRIVSGDQAPRVSALGHPSAHASLTPMEKLQMVSALRKQNRKVLFVGDGVNDAAAMAESHAALTVEGAAGLAGSAACGALSQDALPRLPELLRIAREARSLAGSNLNYAAAYNLAGILVAAAGLLHPVFAALVMTCSSLIVVWRAAAFLTPDLEERLP